MHITKIELEDIKSHVRFSHDFRRGTTAIVGENGAGKTTIIEAVAWTLFDLLDYRKEDFVRRGAKKGSARVTFESGEDERRYQVYRDTGTGYYVYDPELKIRIADKKEEVTRFLWRHLGVDPGTDLEVLFRTAIGVPQGTFTAVFLETVNGRKKAFDKLLKVDDYRLGADKLRETSRFVELKIVAVRERIARAEGELSRIETVEKELAEFRAQAESHSKAVAEAGAEAESRRAAVVALDEVERRVIELRTELDRMVNARSRAEFVVGQREVELKASIGAADLLSSLEADHKAHLSSLAAVRELERERLERDRVRQAIATVETARANSVASRKRFEEELARIAETKATVERLRPDADRSASLEADRDSLRAEIARREPSEAEAGRLQVKVARLREDYARASKEVRTLTASAEAASELGRLETEAATLVKTLAANEARLDADRRFQKEIRNGLCPVLSAKCLNLENGMTLEDFVGSRFEAIEAEIVNLRTAIAANSKQLGAAREAHSVLKTLEIRNQRLTELAAEGKAAADEMNARIEEAAALPDLRTRLAAIDQEIAKVGDARARLIAAENEIAREGGIRAKLTEAEASDLRFAGELESESAKLAAFSDLDERWAKVAGERDRTERSHRDYLANESIAAMKADRERLAAEARAELEKLTADLAKAEKDAETAGREYDRERHQNERAALFATERRLAESRAHLANAESRVTQLSAELERLGAVRREMEAEFLEKERLEKVFEASEFIRATLKKSAPLVARNYVYHVSLEAAQMFREITGNPERNLKWTEDYAIVLEEGGFERPFAVLSGGEQMAAALSVRLALLKQLSDIRLAFFDEPTTNMDAIRRERLAEQIALISQRKTFDQLFVISHDDTFENFADSVVPVGESEIERAFGGETPEEHE